MNCMCITKLIMKRNKILPRLTAAALCLALLACLSAGAAAETTEDLLKEFRLRHGSRDSRRIAITMDDVFETEWVWKSVELCRQYGIRMTFFPLGLSLKEEDRENWLDVLDAGCEIGSHSYNHLKFHDIPAYVAWNRLGNFQEALDRTLGMHYPVRWFRPPFGSITDQAGGSSRMYSAITRFGYDHILLWDVSETNPEKAAGKVQNGSILLYHARVKDYECLEKLIPVLLEAGFEPVTVSELFEMEQPMAGGDIFIYDSHEFTGY